VLAGGWGMLMGKEVMKAQIGMELPFGSELEQ
jgi:hypothetical protein